MRKLYCILLCGFIVLGVLGCADKDTFAGANREERIIMSLEKTYPEHTFQIVKPYDKYNGNYYAVCEDEKGIQFKVHTIMYDNRYHFGCYDQYLVEIEKKGNFINKTAEIAKKHGYDIYNISVSFIDKKKGIKLKWCPSYREVLWLFNNATCIITDSFHATAFSINLNKNFVTFLPKKSTSRNRSILKLFDLESRSIENCEDFETPEKNIDYEKVNVILEEERKKSLDYLDYMLRNVN